jgi:signal transduction histidine kinase
LGLTLVKNILASHSAQILVKSELQKGTTFYVNFTVV